MQRDSPYQGKSERGGPCRMKGSHRPPLGRGVPGPCPGTAVAMNSVWEVTFFPTHFQIHLPGPELPKRFPNQSAPFLVCSRGICQKLVKCSAQWAVPHWAPDFAQWVPCSGGGVASQGWHLKLPLEPWSLAQACPLTLGPMRRALVCSYSHYSLSIYYDLLHSFFVKN